MRGVVMHWRVVFVGLIGLVCMVCGCAAEPQHLSWSEQLAFLQARAYREDPEAVLRRCFTRVTDDSYTISLDLNDLHRLAIDCEWLVPLGRYLQIDYVDDALSQTMNVYRVGPPLTVDTTTLRTLEHAQGAIQLGPREVLAAVQPLSQQFMATEGEIMSIGLWLWMGSGVNAEHGVPAIWQVSHGSWDGTNQYLYISAVDGTILEEKWEETLRDSQVVPPEQ
ncbi:MAG: hypothetical protein AAGF95_28295 [Chloroflexota bacterium]